MGSSGLPFPTSNNAPLPIPGSYGNPTGGFSSGTGSPFPMFPSYGGGNYSMPNAGGPSYNVGSFGTGAGLAGLNSGLGFNWGQGYGSDVYNMLGKAYGKGTGQLLGNILSGGLYNPQVAAAMLNAQQPGIARGEAGIEGAFGDAGARFSSAAALGLGDFESQVQLNQQQTLAQMFEQSQGQELSLLTGVLPTLHQEQADKGSWLNDLLGGLETAGGVASAFIPGMQGLAPGLISGGIGNITGKGGGLTPMMMPGMTGFGMPGYGGNTGTFGANAPSWLSGSMDITTPEQQSIFDWMNSSQDMQASGGGVWQNSMGDGGDVPIPIY